MFNPILFFGPARSTPSWHWVGNDVATYLSSSEEVRIFQDENQLPNDAMVFWIKAPPKGPALHTLMCKRARVVFFPVDTFHSVSDIADANEFLNFCHLIALHSASLAPFFDPAKVRHVNHNKYGIAPASRRPGGELLWIGGFQYSPYVLRFLLGAQLPTDAPVIMLSDSNNPTAVIAAERLAFELGLGKGFGPQTIAGCANLVQWSEAKQQQLLSECRAAFDIKDMSNFNQRHKPPTKLQKFLCSGIPTAVSASLPLLESVSVSIPEPDDTVRWLGAEFEMDIQREGERLRPSLSLETIARCYQAFAAEVILDGAAAMDYRQRHSID